MSTFSSFASYIYIAIPAMVVLPLVRVRFEEEWRGLEGVGGIQSSTSQNSPQSPLIPLNPLVKRINQTGSLVVASSLSPITYATYWHPKSFEETKWKNTLYLSVWFILHKSIL
jgi:hypothetical protein